jgi:hypothetical protein
MYSISNFNYLGFNVGSDKINISAKLQIFQQIYVTIIRSLSVNFREETRLKFYNTSIMAIPSVLYGSECWTPTEGEKGRLEAVEICSLIAVSGR